ncbi:transposase [mine drainage metagenome]|uniref:Transposase n=2 Tax=mine drainage metagenome TaxID=410659 RepID=T0YAG8_9ZZZZ
MWCIQIIDEEYRKRMYDILDLYSSDGEDTHVIAIDEKPKPIRSDKRKSIPMKPGSPERYDYEYVRRGKANIFVALEPKKGKHMTMVTRRRTKKDFAGFVKCVLEKYHDGKKIHIVLDNLNTHFRGSFEETFGKDESDAMLSRVEFHYTPKHASWLNIAEIEINVMDMECTDRQFDSYSDLKKQVKAWTKKRSRDKKEIQWNFDKELSKYYV